MILPDTHGYAPSEKGSNNPHIGFDHEDFPLPAYAEAVDRSKGYAPPSLEPRRSDRLGGTFVDAYLPRAQDDWARSIPPDVHNGTGSSMSTPYEGQQQPNEKSSDRGAYQSYARYPPAGMASQTYAAYASTSGMASQPQGSYTSQYNTPYQTHTADGTPFYGITPARYASTPGFNGSTQTDSSASLHTGPGLGMRPPASGGYSHTPQDGMRSSSAPAPSRGGGGILEHLRNAAPGQSVSELVDPPPPSFLRPPRPDLPYEHFEPASLVSLNKDLDKGFPQLPPPSRAVPHPFATHDVAENDWQRFLHDVKLAGSLSPANRIAAAVAPISMHAGLTGMLVTKGIEHVMRNKKTGAVGELIDLWNVYFFHPRWMTIILAKGSVTYNGPEGAPPPDATMHADDSSSSSSSEDEGHKQDGGRHATKDQRRQERRARKAEHKAQKEERKARKEERKAERKARKGKKKDDEKWRLIIAYQPDGGF